MATDDLSNVENARAALFDVRRTLIDRQYELEVRTAELDGARRTLAGEDLGPYEDAVTEADTALRDIRAEEANALQTLQQRLDEWMQTTATEALASAEEDIARLQSSSPIVLFPVRLETRFLDNKLKVRVYPDEIFINTHEIALTQEEQDWAKRYYEELNEKDNEKELWRDIVARFGVNRSAYILRAMLPVFGAPGPTSNWSASSSTCGGTIYGGNNRDLYFPTVQTRSANWTRPGEAVLPDRWVVITYTGKTKRYTLGARIIEPLAVTPDPKAIGDEAQSELFTATDGAYKIDDNVRWTVDFARAVSVGMGVEVALQGQEAVTGFERVVVVGVKTSMNALDTSRMLELLFDGHHYTRGAAMVKQGSPTNNTEAATTPYPPKDDAGKLSFIVERQRAPLDRDHAHHCLPHTSDGYHLARMLGIPSGVMANVDRAYELEVERGKSMNQLLWHGTLGYFMRHMMDAAVPGANPVFTPAQINDAERYFTNHVLARGPAPALRIGAAPYGVLPISSLSLWEFESSYIPTSDERVERALRDPLRRMLATWVEGSELVPRIKPTTADPDREVARILANYASAQEFWIRDGQTYDITFWLNYLFGVVPTATFRELLTQTRETFEQLGLTGLQPAIGVTLWNSRAARSVWPAVASELSETNGLVDNYIAALRDAGGVTNAGARAINEDSYVPAEFPRSLFREVLRRSALSLFAGIAASQESIRWTEFGLFGIPAIPVASVIPSVYQLDNSDSLRPLATDFYKALSDLALTPSAELDRLFRASMDACSRRIDAWVTAFAYRRLVNLRTQQEYTHLASVGDYIGGYGWLTDVRPVPRVTEPVVAGSSRLVERQGRNGGFVHTPSMTHASAAALLRNAHLSAGSGDAGTFAVDLSSRRVRQARELFEAVRNGQPVGALLGYRLERALKDNYTGLDAMRYALRKKYPLVANKGGSDDNEPTESIAARSVIDGEMLLRAYLADELDLTGDPALPSQGHANYTILTGELDKLAAIYDAAADLLTAEAAYQLASGNISAASPTMANVVEGRNPPDSVLSRSARRGVGISHTVALVFHQSTAIPLSSNWPAVTPRAAAEPVLNVWLGQMIGDPDAIEASISYQDENGDVIDSRGGDSSVVVSMSELGLHPLDFLALAEALAQPHQASILDLRLIAVAVADAQRGPSRPPVSYQVNYLSSAASFPRILEVLNTALKVLGQARPLNMNDLVPPTEKEEARAFDDAQPAPSQAALDFYQRSLDAAAALSSAATQLATALASETLVREALLQASAFISFSAFPDPRVFDSALLDSARAVNKELSARVGKLPAEYTVPANASSAQLTTNGQERLTVVFGPSFVAMPEFEPPRTDELGMSLGARSTLLGGDEGAPDRYLQQMMRARPRLGAYRKLNLYARTAGLPRATVDVLQLPHVPGERWLGLPFETRPDQGRAAMLLLNYEPDLDPSVPWKGLVVDDWNEVIPNEIEETGFAMHYNSPQAQAPQAILVAAPARVSTNWSFDELLSSLEQTMDLMKARAVESEHVPLGQLFPPMVVGENPNIENSVTTKFTNDDLIRPFWEAFDG